MGHKTCYWWISSLVPTFICTYLCLLINNDGKPKRWGGGHIWDFDLFTRIVIYFVVNHNDSFEHFCVARYWHDESSGTTLAELKIDSWNLSMPLDFNSNVIRRCWGWKYTIAGAGKIPARQEEEKEHVSKALETLQLPQNIGELPPHPPRIHEKICSRFL